MFRRRDKYSNMMGIDRESYRDMTSHIKDSQTIEELTRQLGEANMRFFDLCGEIRELEHENGALREMFKREGDTSVIKYNGKLFKIIETSRFKSEDCPDTLSIDAVAIYPEDE